MMDASVTEFETIRSILNQQNEPMGVDSRLKDFIQYLTDHTFRPLPHQLKTLPIVGALARWSDLKPAVQQELTHDVMLKWNTYDDAAEMKPVEEPLIENKKNSDHCPDETQKSLAPEVKSTPSIPPGNPSPLYQTNTRRDWFDIILDSVAVIVKPIMELVSPA